MIKASGELFIFEAHMPANMGSQSLLQTPARHNLFFQHRPNPTLVCNAFMVSRHLLQFMAVINSLDKASKLKFSVTITCTN